MSSSSIQALVYWSESEADTEALGQALAAALPDGSVVALNGPLGAGKTRLVQALAEANGVDRRDCVSPTFVLVHEYRGRRPIYHFDVYRLRDDDEFLELGPEEYFDRPGISLIEWAQRVQRCLPHQRLEIAIEPTGPTSRRFQIEAVGPRYAEVVAMLAERLT